MELRTLTLAVMQKNDCCVFCRQTELIFLVSGIWTLYFKSRKSEIYCVEHWAKKIQKHHPKTCSKHVGTLWETIKGIFWTLKFFRFFWKFSKARPSMEQWEKTSLSKKAPKHVWTLGNDLENLRTLKFFLIFFLNLFYVSTSNFKSGKPNSNVLSPENWPHIFKSRKSEKPCMEHWAKQFGKIASKHVQNTFGHFWKRIWALLEFWKFFDFFCNFSKTRPSMEHWAKILFSKRTPQNTFGHLGTVLDNFRTLNFFSPFPWNFTKSLPQNLSPENRTHFFKSWKLISYF